MNGPPVHWHGTCAVHSRKDLQQHIGGTCLARLALVQVPIVGKPMRGCKRRSDGRWATAPSYSQRVSAVPLVKRRGPTPQPRTRTEIGYNGRALAGLGDFVMRQS